MVADATHLLTSWGHGERSGTGCKVRWICERCKSDAQAVEAMVMVQQCKRVGVDVLWVGWIG